MTENTTSVAASKANYTPAMESILEKGYNPDASETERTSQVAALAVELDRTTRSVIAKLSNMQLYVPKTYKTKTGSNPVRKSQIVAAIAAKANVDEDIVGSLESATKNALIVVYNTIVKAQAENETEETS